ncbi:MAG: DUF3460 family protein [Burkholderiaceae bacterium]
MTFLARFFGRPDYRSEVTQFIDQMKQDAPALESQQRAGRALLWDKPPLQAAQRSEQALDLLAQPAYVYQTEPSKARLPSGAASQPASYIAAE